MPNPTILLLPVETKTREFLAKIFFAGHAARRGFTALLGCARFFHANTPRFPRGIVMENDISVGSTTRLPELRRLGFGVAAWDEEALVVKNDPYYVDERVRPEALYACHKFFTRGSGDLEAIATRYPLARGHMTPAGNPRLDILEPQYRHLHRHTAIQSDRPILLVNSRFSHSNPFHMSPEAFRKALLARSGLSGQALEFKISYMDYTDKLYSFFKEMVAQLPARFPDHLVVIRPHPSENPNVWNAIAEEHENCICSKKHTATEWSMAAVATIHNGCTTALEAALLGCRVLAYCPTTSGSYDVQLPNAISEQYDNTFEMFAALEHMHIPSDVERDALSTAARHRVAPQIAGLSGCTATDHILDELESLRWTTPIAPRELLRAVRYLVRYWRQESAVALRIRNNTNALQAIMTPYALEKFPGATMEEVRGILDGFGMHDVLAEDMGNWWFRMVRA